MEEDKIKSLTALLDDRTMTLMERESDLADRLEEIDAQKEELSAAIEELEEKNKTLVATLTQLKERNQELDQILYRFSHDLRSPVSSILGVLGVLKYESLNENQQTCFDHIREKSVQMDDLLKSLSTLAKTINNDIHFSEFRMDELIKNCISDGSLNSNFPDVEIGFQFSGDTEVCSDRLLVCLLIKNVLINSLTFREPFIPGVVTIRLAVTGNFFEIEIEDDGEGISDQIKENIFKMFYRGSERSKGSGLGLYIVYKIVEQLKGEINFSSEKGSTIFKIKLPFSYQKNYDTGA